MARPNAEELERLANMPLHSAKEFAAFTGIGINAVRKGMRENVYPVHPKHRKGEPLGKNHRVIVRLALERIEGGHGE